MSASGLLLCQRLVLALHHVGIAFRCNYMFLHSRHPQQHTARGAHDSSVMMCPIAQLRSDTLTSAFKKNTKKKQMPPAAAVACCRPLL
jgi:hypothetical protein